MKLLNRYKKLIAGFILFALTSFTVGVVSAFIQPGSIQYKGDSTPPASEPAFNVFYDVPSVGNEADFIRVKKAGEKNSQYRNSIDTVCETGDRFNVWIYAHNGASVSGNNNGSGPSVIQNANARVDLDNSEETDRFDIKGFLSSSNAGSIEDGAVIDCGDHKYKMKFVEGTAFLDLPNQTVNLPAAVVGPNGTPIGTNALDGIFWGCWEQRVWMGITVEVEKVEEPVLHPAVCDALLYTILANNQVRVDKVEFTENDATVNSISVDYGDGTVSSQIPNTHTYEKEGDYTIRATLKTTFEGQSKDVTSPKCVAKITVKREEQPKFACEMFTLKMNDRTANVSFKPVASNGAVFKNAQINYLADGESKNEIVTDKVNAEGKVVSSFTYAEGVKNIQVIAKVRFSVGEGKDTVTKEVTCSGKAVLGTSIEKCPIPNKTNLDKNNPDCKEVPPTTIPDTGAGSVAGLFAAVTAVGAVAHRKLTLRRS